MLVKLLSPMNLILLLYELKGKFYFQF